MHFRSGDPNTIHELGRFERSLSNGWTALVAVWFEGDLLRARYFRLPIGAALNGRCFLKAACLTAVFVSLGTLTKPGGVTVQSDNPSHYLSLFVVDEDHSGLILGPRTPINPPGTGY